VKFSVNSAILPNDRYFKVDLSPWIQSQLIPKLEKSFCTILISPRANGKSTCIHHTVKLLKNNNYISCILNFERVNFEDAKSFWYGISSQISLLTGRNISFYDQVGFSTIFYNRTNSPFYGFHVFLFIDEFDLITTNKEIMDSFLGTLRGIKHERDNYTLKSVVAVGTFALTELTDPEANQPVFNVKVTDKSFDKRSPFNAAETTKYPFFTLEETTSLFNQFNTFRKETLPIEIVNEIFIYTNGHRGLTCLIGKLIDEDFRRELGGRILNANEWKVFHSRIPNYVHDYPTLNKVMNLLRSDDELAKNARTILSTYYLPYSQAILQPRPVHLRVTKWLAANGILMSHSPGFYRMTSPLIREIILSKVTPIDRRKTPSEPPERLENHMLDMETNICKAVEFFNSETIIQSYNLSFKKNRGSIYERDACVPEEAVYHFELYTILSSWFPDSINILPEVLPYPDTEDRSLSRQRCDILITEGLTKYLLEIEASDSSGEIAAHANRLETQKLAIGAHQAWLIYFSPAKNFTWPIMGDNCFSLAIVHDNLYSKIEFYTSPTDVVMMTKL